MKKLLNTFSLVFLVLFSGMAQARGGEWLLTSIDIVWFIGVFVLAFCFFRYGLSPIASFWDYFWDFLLVWAILWLLHFFFMWEAIFRDVSLFGSLIDAVFLAWLASLPFRTGKVKIIRR